MISCETAVVYVAVKRSIKRDDVEAGYTHINHITNKFEKYDKEWILKCFKKWIKHKNLSKVV